MLVRQAFILIIDYQQKNNNLEKSFEQKCILLCNNATLHKSTIRQNLSRILFITLNKYVVLDKLREIDN